MTTRDLAAAKRAAEAKEAAGWLDGMWTAAGRGLNAAGDLAGRGWRTARGAGAAGVGAASTLGAGLGAGLTGNLGNPASPAWQFASRQGPAMLGAGLKDVLSLGHPSDSVGKLMADGAAGLRASGLPGQAGVAQGAAAVGNAAGGAAVGLAGAGAAARSLKALPAAAAGSRIAAPAARAVGLAPRPAAAAQAAAAAAPAAKAAPGLARRAAVGAGKAVGGAGLASLGGDMAADAEAADVAAATPGADVEAELGSALGPPAPAGAAPPGRAPGVEAELDAALAVPHQALGPGGAAGAAAAAAGRAGALGADAAPAAPRVDLSPLSDPEWNVAFHRADPAGRMQLLRPFVDPLKRGAASLPKGMRAAFVDQIREGAAPVTPEKAADLARTPAGMEVAGRIRGSGSTDPFGAIARFFEGLGPAGQAMMMIGAPLALIGGLQSLLGGGGLGSLLLTILGGGLAAGGAMGYGEQAQGWLENLFGGGEKAQATGAAGPAPPAAPATASAGRDLSALSDLTLSRLHDDPNNPAHAAIQDELIRRHGGGAAPWMAGAARTVGLGGLVDRYVGSAAKGEIEKEVNRRGLSPDDLRYMADAIGG